MEGGWKTRAWVAVAAAALPHAPAAAQSVSDLSALSIEELSQVEVVSASKRAEPLASAPTAIYVISNEDILRSAATSLPEVLRQAPNLDVQQIDARQYAISARGFNGYETANKMLALIDGRSIYTPLFSGVLWELHSPLLEDIEQIEVISGPGGTLYGPNAVNGVINVRSKNAIDTIGGMARGTAAANEQTAALRYGVGIGDSGAVRVYGNYFNRDDRPDGAGPDLTDGTEGFQAGFRADLESDIDQFTLQGDIFDTNVETAPGDGERGYNVLGRWTRQVGDASALQIQGYYDYYRRHFFMVLDSLETMDVEAQLNSSSGRHDFVVGAGLRTTRDALINPHNPIGLVPDRKRLWVGNVFAQDHFAVTDQLSLILGVKLEDSSFSGVEVLPNLRVAWQLDPDSLLWGAVSRAVRTPSRVDRELAFPPFLAPASDFRSEKLTAIEFGYRGQPSDTTSISVNLFYNLYDDLRTIEQVSPDSATLRLANRLHGETWGIEAWASQRIAAWWRVRLGVTTFGKRFKVDEGEVDLGDEGTAGNDPAYRVTFRSQMNLTSDLLLDVGLRAIDDLEFFPTDGYVEADARIGWQVSDAVELYVAGSNLLHKTHAESGDPKREQLAERSVYAGARLRF